MKDEIKSLPLKLTFDSVKKLIDLSHHEKPNLVLSTQERTGSISEEPSLS